MNVMKVEIKYPEGKCKWCGKTYTKTHNRQEYCSNHCRKEARREQNRNHRLHNYYKNRKKEHQTTIGTRTIGAKRNPDPEREAEIVQNEIQRIGLKMF